jgi:2-keto-3-deoxy-L-rhamnonate aldolase RhmA
MGNVLISDILRNNVKEKLARDEVVASMTVRLIRTIEIARIARTAGFDSLYVDLEHSSFSLETCGQICMAAVEAGIAPFVRVPANTPDYIARVLEGGALGIIAPHVHSADEAQTVVRAAKFSPLGERSNAGGLPHLHFRTFPAPEAYAALNDATMVIVQFESAAALDKTEEIGRSTASIWCWSGSTICWRTGAFPDNTIIRGYARPMPAPSRPAAGTASIAA